MASNPLLLKPSHLGSQNLGGESVLFSGSRAVNQNALSWIFHRWPTNVGQPAAACTFANGSANVTCTHNGYGVTGFRAKYATNGTLPAELNTSTYYFCNTVDGTHYTNSLTFGGTPIVMSGTGSGSHTVELSSMTPLPSLQGGIFNTWDSAINWRSFHTSSGVFDWTVTDAKFLPAITAGYKIVFRFGFTPLWAGQAKWAAVVMPGYGTVGGSSPPANNADVTAAMAAMVTRYGAGIYGFEVCNEPDMLARNAITFSGAGGTDPLPGTTVENLATGATGNVISVSGSVITVDGMTGNGWANADTIRKLGDSSWSRTVVSQAASSVWSGTYAETAAMARAMRVWLDANAPTVKLFAPGFAPGDVNIQPNSRLLIYLATSDGGGGTPAQHHDFIGAHDYMNTAAEVRKAYQTAAFNMTQIPNLRSGCGLASTEHGNGGLGGASTDVRTARLCHDLACAIIYNWIMCVYAYDSSTYWTLFSDITMQTRVGAFWQACLGKTLTKAVLLANDNIKLTFSDDTSVQSALA